MSRCLCALSVQLRVFLHACELLDEVCPGFHAHARAHSRQHKWEQRRYEPLTQQAGNKVHTQRARLSPQTIMAGESLTDGRFLVQRERQCKTQKVIESSLDSLLKQLAPDVTTIPRSEVGYSASNVHLSVYNVKDRMCALSKIMCVRAA